MWPAQGEYRAERGDLAGQAGRESPCNGTRRALSEFAVVLWLRGRGSEVVGCPRGGDALGLELRPVEDEQADEEGSADEEANGALVGEVTPMAIPERDEEEARYDERPDREGTPPGLSEESSNASKDETQSTNDQTEIGYGPREVVAEALRECPRSIRPRHAWLKLENPSALAQVEKVNATVEYEQDRVDESEHDDPLWRVRGGIGRPWRCRALRCRSPSGWVPRNYRREKGCQGAARPATLAA